MSHKIRKIIFIVVSIFFVLSSNALAETYYISPSGNDRAGDGSYLNPWRTSIKAFNKGSGNTYIFKDGIYDYERSEIQYVPNGTDSSYTVVKAENDGGAIIKRDGGLFIESTRRHIQIEGFKFDYPGNKTILGQYIKFFRCSFAKGPAVNNTVNTIIGTNASNDTANILIEDCWFYGAGGRYNLLVFNADKVIVRRCVIRHDGGWDDRVKAGDPEAGLCFYNSSNCFAQNVITIDSDGKYSTWVGGFFGVNNESTKHSTQGNEWTGCISLAGKGVGLTLSTDSSKNNLIQDCVLWDTANGGISFGGRGSNDAVLNRLTIGRSRVRAEGGFKGGIGAWNTGLKTITNVIITNFAPSSDMDGVSATYFDTYNNGLSFNIRKLFVEAGRFTYNPQHNGLRYLCRIENASHLKTDGKNRSQIGADIVKKIGKSGTLYGENGYNDVTNENLWPWLNEDRIKVDMSSNSKRGFCADGMTLTKYIWEYLGNPIPPEIYGGESRVGSGE